MITEFFEEAFVEAHGFRIRYVELGSGHPIIHLYEHGGLRPSPVHELLAKYFRVILIEIPRTQDVAPIEELARRMSSAVNALGLKRYSLMSTSSASNVALRIASLSLESVEAIVLSTPDALDDAFYERAAELQQPVLVLLGTADKVTPPEGVRRFREILQNCHIVFVYGAGQAIDADRPKAFASVVGDFLTRKEQFLVRETSALIHPEGSR